MNKLTVKQKEILEHSLGLNYKKHPFRNYYCSCPGNEDDEIIKQLVEMNLMHVKHSPILGNGGYYAFVTNLGLLEVYKGNKTLEDIRK